MPKINKFYEMDVWKKSHIIVLEIYKISEQFPIKELYGITSQLRRGASSITANIAEGFGRYYFKDKIRFFYQASGSVFEVQNFLMLSKDLNFIEPEICNNLVERCNQLAQLINGFIRHTEKYTRKSNM